MCMLGREKDIIAVVKETGALSDLISKTTQKPVRNLL